MTEQDEKISQNPEIFEIASADDLAKIEGLEMLKYVHLRDKNGDRVFVGDESKIDHWQLTGLDQETAIKTPIFNAGLIYQTVTDRRVLLGFSGGLRNETSEFVDLARLNPAKKLELDKETVRVLNTKTEGENFEVKPRKS